MRLYTLQLKRAVSVVLFFVLLSAVGMTKALAQSFTVDNLNYSVNSDGVSVTVTGHVDGTAATGELVIPETVTYNESTYFVTAIGNNAFSECTGFTGNLVIPNSVNTIGEWAFCNCTGFTGYLVISNSVNTISAYAFRNCTNFSSVEYNATDCADLSGHSPFLDCGGTLIIGENVEHIPARMFSNAAFTGSLIIPNSVTSIGEWAFYNCTGFTGNLVIPNSVNTISAYAFRNCTNFFAVEYNATDCADLSGGSPFLDCGGTLTIGENVERIPAQMFSDAAFTGSLIIPNSVTIIGNDAFYGCTGFTGSLVIPNSVNTISAHAFRNCTNFSSVEYNATDCADVDVTMPPFEHCGGTLTIGENVERIPANMFKWAAFTGSLIIPNSVTIIGNDAFYECTGFTGNLVIPNSMTTIGDYAFRNCTNFSSVEYDATDCADLSGHSPFLDCGGTLTIGENVERIPDQMFSNAAFTGSLIIPNSVTSIGEWAFYNCTGFTGDLVISNSVNTISAYAFRSCTNFSSVEYNATDCADLSSGSPFLDCGGTLTIGENVERIPAQMFSNAAFTGSLIIPNSVTSIGSYAFYNCTGFSSVEFNATNCADASGCCQFQNCGGTLTIGENVERIPAHMFEYVAFTGRLIIPNSVTTIGYMAFYWCTGFTGNLVIPNSVTTIGGNAFGGCTGFSSVEYNATNCTDASSSWPPFRNCGVTLTIGENVERIPANMFKWAAFTGSLIIPNSVTSIGEWAFHGCTGFTGDLVIPNSVTTIGEAAFRSCTNFSTVEYNATDCADLSSGSPFLDCGGTLTIGENVERIPAQMFSNAAFTGSLIIPNSVTTIGYNAFRECTGFTGNLVISNSVTAIGEYAFKDCTGFSSVEYNATDCADASVYSPFENCGSTLTIGENVERIPARMFSNAAFTLILSHAEIPPTVGIYAFYGIDHDIPVYVPCGSLSDYQNADGWKEFNNIFSNNCFEITVTVTPANSGTVTGAGTYNYGATATLTATANTGYAFIKWTKDGTVVSTNPTYSFTVTEDVELVANFKLPGDANGDGTVNALDVVIIVNHIFGLPTEKFVFDNADVNGDGVVDALDIVIIVNIIFSKNS